MSIWTKEELHTQIIAWKAALTAAATGKAYTIGGRSLTRQNLPEIREHLEYLNRELQVLERGSSLQVRRALVIR